MSRLNLALLGLLPVIALWFTGFHFQDVGSWAQNLLGGMLRTRPPPIVFASICQWSHTEEMIQIADGLIQRGYPVTFLGCPLFRDEGNASGPHT